MNFALTPELLDDYFYMRSVILREYNMLKLMVIRAVVEEQIRELSAIERWQPLDSKQRKHLHRLYVLIKMADASIKRLEDCD